MKSSMRGSGPQDADLEHLARRLGRKLLAAGQRVTTAESCTGGWISKAITDISGSSAWFGESFVTYSNEAKVVRLGVARALLDRHGAVSRAVARAMAAGALARARAIDPTVTLAVAVTGIAGPDGGVPGKPVGTVWFCWARGAASGRGRRIVLESEVRQFRGDREAVRRKTVRRALLGLLGH